MTRTIVVALLLVATVAPTGCGPGDADQARTTPDTEASTTETGGRTVTSTTSLAASSTTTTMTGDTAPTTSQGVGNAPGSDTFEPVAVGSPCPPGAPTNARCRRVEVPANWNEPAGPRIVLPVVVVPATGPLLSPDPLVVLAGGPGGSDLAAAAAWSDPHRDVVLYDQRGSGAAQPVLTCPERDDVWVANLQRDLPFEDERAAIVEAFGACRTRLEAAGIDLDDYDTEASVRDLDAIRVALGYAEWNILGASYGARLALAAMRSTPSAIRSVVLDSVSDVTAGGPAATQQSGDRAFAELVLACAEHAVCAAAHPDLAGDIDGVELRYNTAPVILDVDLDDGRGPQRFVITGTDMMAGLFQAMYDPALLALIPSIVGDLATGDTAIVEAMIRRGVVLQESIAWGMNLTMNCADGAGLDPGADARAIERPGRFRLLLAVPLCSQWPVEATSSTFNEPITSDIPTLVMAGRFDPITPPDGSESVARRLTNATFALWPNRGHGVTGDPCANTVLAAFLDDPGAAVDLSCVESLAAPAFQ